MARPLNPLLGRARPDYAPGETFTAPAVPLDPPPAGVKSMSGFERYCEPPKPPPGSSGRARRRRSLSSRRWPGKQWRSADDFHT